MKRGMAVAGLIVVTAIWGGGFVASDIALNSLTPMQIMAIRFLLGAVLMSFISVREFRNINLKEIGAGVLMGIALFAAFALQIIGLQYTTPSKNAFLTALNVVMVPFIAFLVLRKTRRMAWRTGGLLVRCRRGGAFVERQYDAPVWETHCHCCARLALPSKSSSPVCSCSGTVRRFSTACRWSPHSCCLWLRWWLWARCI